MAADFDRLFRHSPISSLTNLQDAKLFSCLGGVYYLGEMATVVIALEEEENANGGTLIQ